MPSGEVTLQRIQREIYEVKLREEELRKKYANGGGVNGDGGDSSGGEGGETELTNGHGASSPTPLTMTNGGGNTVLTLNNTINNNNNNSFAPQERPKQQRSLSTPNGTTNDVAAPDISLNLNKTKTRRFAPNSSTKGVMQRFIKSKGKIGALATLTSLPTSNSWNATIEDTILPPRVSLEPGKQLRKGYVPVGERMMKEFKEMHVRENELKLERRKSQSDLLNMDDDDEYDEEADKQVVGASKMRSARSVSHLSDSRDYPDDTQSEPCSLKPARSLAQLCDADDEELEAPGSLTLIRQWESIIQKNQQLRT